MPYLILFQLARTKGLKFLETSAKANINIEKVSDYLTLLICESMFPIIFLTGECNKKHSKVGVHSAYLTLYI